MQSKDQMTNTPSEQILARREDVLPFSVDNVRIDKSTIGLVCPLSRAMLPLLWQITLILPPILKLVYCLKNGRCTSNSIWNEVLINGDWLSISQTIVYFWWNKSDCLRIYVLARIVAGCKVDFAVLFRESLSMLVLGLIFWAVYFRWNGQMVKWYLLSGELEEDAAGVVSNCLLKE